MIPESLRHIPNPYQTITPTLSPKQFIGRDDEIQQLRRVLDNYLKTTDLRNFVITGDKSIGKSTLLNRYKQILEDYRFLTYEIELPIGNTEIDEFEIIKDLISELFEKFSPPEGVFFDTEQSQIWFSLTTDKYDDDSSFHTRKLGFATQYSSKKRGTPESLSCKQLERDFSKIIDELISKEMDISGLAIIIDEFQELSRKSVLLDCLRILTEKLTGILVLGAGLPTFLDNPSFEKFIRTAVPINLKSLDRQEVILLLIKPLQELGYSFYQCLKWFATGTLIEIQTRSGGNPLHVKLLASQMFENFLHDQSVKYFHLNSGVMERVMEFYSQISEKSLRIRRALEACTSDQFNSFSLLYKYEGYSLRAAILLELAFDTILTDSMETIKYTFIHAFQDLWGLQLFTFNVHDISPTYLSTLNTNELSHVEYKFIGDAIDKLYASYVYEAHTSKRLHDNFNMTYDDMLANKFAENLDVVRFESHIAVNRENMPIIQIKGKDDKVAIDNIVHDLSKLEKLAANERFSDDDKKSIEEIAEKHALEVPSYVATVFDLKGYYLLICEISIKGKVRLIYKYFPVTSAASDYKISRYIQSLDEYFPFINEYSVLINNIYIYWIPLQPLSAIVYVDSRKEMGLLIRDMKARHFDAAAARAEMIHFLDLKYKGEKVITGASSYNNYGFCLINTGDVVKARKIFAEIESKFAISRCNMAFLNIREDKYEEAKKVLKSIIKSKTFRDEIANFMHLAIIHPKLPLRHCIIEEVSLFNVACWNLALLISSSDSEISGAYAVLKLAKLSSHERLIHDRVANWVKFNDNDSTHALSGARRLIEKVDAKSYLYKDVLKDIQIFEQYN